MSTAGPSSSPGTYVLVLAVPRTPRISVGRLGIAGFPAGTYLYIGSAWGPGGLRARIAHHFKPAWRPHWHIDYLRRRARVVEEVPARAEHLGWPHARFLEDFTSRGTF